MSMLTLQQGSQHGPASMSASDDEDNTVLIDTDTFRLVDQVHSEAQARNAESESTHENEETSSLAPSLQTVSNPPRSLIPRMTPKKLNATNPVTDEKNPAAVPVRVDAQQPSYSVLPPVAPAQNPVRRSSRRRQQPGKFRDGTHAS